MARISSQDILDHLLDADSYISWDERPVHAAAATDPEYAAALERAEARSGRDEAVITGEGLIWGRRVAVIVGDFDFLAGSIGVAAAERIVHAVERATSLRLPIVASPTSGGTRMQEGTVAFLQMIKISAAVAAHKAAHLPYIVYLRHPTTGGVFASWGSQAHVTFAEPGALIGFLGPRVYEALYDREFPEGVQTSENLAELGVIDGVVPVEHLQRIVARALRVLCHDVTTVRSPSVTVEGPIAEDIPAWESIGITRRPDRPGVHALLRHIATERVPLSGTGQGERDETLSLTLARLRGQPAVVLAQDRDEETPLSQMGPAALREARRGMKLATDLRLPLVLIIDTQGAALSRQAEEGGLAGEIARTIAELVTLPTATLSVIMGQGTGGGALALLPADRVLCAQHGWLAPLPPEGAAAIVHRDVSRAEEMAQAQGVRSVDLRDAGIVDRIVPELPDAADEPGEFCRRLGDAIAAGLDELTRMDPEIRLAQRLSHYRHMGVQPAHDSPRPTPAPAGDRRASTPPRHTLL